MPHLPTKTELERLDAGLMEAQAARHLGGDDGADDFVVPDEIKHEFASVDIEEIRAKIEEAKALGVAAAISLGFCYMALKVKLRGKFKTTLKAEYPTAHRAMCRARAWMIIPEVAERLGIEPVRKLLAISVSDIQAIRQKLIGAPPDLAKTITEKELDRFYYKIQKKKQTGKHSKKKKEYSTEIPDYDQELSRLFVIAKNVLLDIAGLKIDPKHKDQALRAVRDLYDAWDKASYNLSDPEHKTTPRWEMDPVERALDGLSDEASE